MAKTAKTTRDESVPGAYLSESKVEKLLNYVMAKADFTRQAAATRATGPGLPRESPWSFPVSRNGEENRLSRRSPMKSKTKTASELSCGGNCSCASEASRREFLRVFGAGAASAMVLSVGCVRACKGTGICDGHDDSAFCKRPIRPNGPSP